MTAPALYVDVVFPSGIATPLTYRVPEALRSQVQLGKRVVVPLGSRRKVVGYLVAMTETAPAVPAKNLIEISDPEPILDAHLFELTRWITTYHLCAWGEVIRTALPPGIDARPGEDARLTEAGANALAGRAILLDEERALLASVAKHTTLALGPLYKRQPKSKPLVASLLHRGLLAVETRIAEPRVRVQTETYCALAPDVDLATAPVLPRAKQQHAILAALAAASDGLAKAAVATESPAALATLIRKGLVVTREVEVSRDPFAAATVPPDAPRSLAPAQATAVDAIHAALAARRFQPILLYGVTGSGKTEVYLQAIETVLVQGQQALVLVPEISLTPLAVQRFLARFGSRVAVLHSGLTPGERFDAWRRIRAGGADIVVGARSAVFAPLPRLGIVVVDEEHDTSYKQGESPRYHGRDVAIMRAKLLDIPVVLGSATPSFESYERATSGKYQLLTLPERIESRPLPTVDMIDLRHRPKEERLLSAPLITAIAQCLDRGEQTLLFLNRRGFFTVLTCDDCGTTLGCPFCSITLTHHAAQGRLQCHVCGFTRRPPDTCPSCTSIKLKLLGYGTQRLEDALRQRFPAARIGRLDRDTAHDWRAIDRILQQLNTGQIDILVGTQMIGKGHDVPNVTLVGVVNADAALNIPDFRAGERTFSLLTQVVGRAGRGDRPGSALIQAFNPDHYVLTAVRSQDYLALWNIESAIRRETQLPPYSRAILAILSSPSEEAAATAAQEFHKCLRQAGILSNNIKGPAPAPIHRVRSRYRSHIYILGTNTGQMHAQITAAKTTFNTSPLKKGVDLDIDVDPIDL
jgi:primosomal protein N' (replication factor Y)